MQVFFLSALVSSALASNLIATVPRQLQARQDDQSFVPGSTTVSACASDEIECPGEFEGSKYCSLPSAGDTCCRQGYNCPGGSFCLIDGFCCPDVSRRFLFLGHSVMSSEAVCITARSELNLCCGQGLDAASCAAQNGVTLPNSFGASSAASTSPATEAPSSTVVVVTSSTSPVASSVVTSAVATAPYVIPGNASLPVGSGTATGSGAFPGQTSLTPFTGAASAVSVGTTGAIAAFLGLGVIAAWL
ncbi:hypothetical protein G7Y79_00004g014100 [Physcia stellaris]|nr:hypothetical protein G7Y79_00004g014100 [Physcia stellaris]